MKKPLLIALFLVLFLIPVMAGAQGLVPCNGPDCTISSFFVLLVNIYHFIVWDLATPLAIIALMVGGIIMMVSAGNPSTFAKGREIVKWAIIGLVLVFCSWVIINGILGILGVSNWAKL